MPYDTSIDAMTRAEYNRLRGRSEDEKLRQPSAPYRIVGNSPHLDGRLSEFQACRSSAAAAKSAAMARGKRFKLTNVRIIHLID